MDQIISVEHMEEAINMFGFFDESIKIIEHDLTVSAVSLDWGLKRFDEAQNTSRKRQMKMFLTRMGFGSKSVITDDVTQMNLLVRKVSRLRGAMRVLDGVEVITVCHRGEADVTHHIAAQRMIKACEDDEHRRAQKSAKAGRKGQ